MVICDLTNDKNIRRILVVQFRQIGDVLLTTPFLRILRRHFADTEIDFLTEPGPARVMEGNNNIREILLFRYRHENLKALCFYRSLKDRNYDLTFDLQSTTGTALASFLSGARHRVGYRVRGRRFAYTIQVPPPGEGEYTAVNRLCQLKTVGIHDIEWDLDLNLSKEDIEFAGNFYNSLRWNDEFIVAVSPTSRRQTRRWTAKGFTAAVAMMIKKYGAKVVLLWGPGEEEYVRNIAGNSGKRAVLIPPTGIKQMAAIIARANVLITNNNGPKHLATALGVPTVTIYGSSSDRDWNPPDRINHRVVKADIPCIGCHLSFCDHLSCMHLVNEHDVEYALHQIPLLKPYLQISKKNSIKG